MKLPNKRPETGEELVRDIKRVKRVVRERFRGLTDDEALSCATDGVADAHMKYDATKGSSFFSLACRFAKAKAVDVTRSSRFRRKHSSELAHLYSPVHLIDAGLHKLVYAIHDRELIPEHFFHGHDHESTFFRRARHLGMDCAAMTVLVAVAILEDVNESLHAHGHKGWPVTLKLIVQLIGEMECVSVSHLHAVEPLLVKNHFLSHVDEEHPPGEQHLALGPEVKKRWKKMLGEKSNVHSV